MTHEHPPTILVVDNEEYLRHAVVNVLEQNGYRCAQAADGHEALDALAAHEYALVIADIRLPGMSGVELLQAARRLHADTAFIMLAGVDGKDTAVRALELGAYSYLIQPFEHNELLINVAHALRRRDLEQLRNDFEHQLEREAYKRTEEIRRREEEITLHLVSASEYREEETGAHVRRIAKYTAVLAEKAGWSTEQIELLRLAAPMHDIGKIGVPDNILQKPGRLTLEEFDNMKLHTTIGLRILEGSDCTLLQMAGSVALSHHERWDGSGYPHGLVGEAIPECARIVAIADVYDALHTDRVYRPAFTEKEALAILVASQAQFDPKLFACLVDSYTEFGDIRREFNDDALF
jgi:putative two-component system response regulator